MVIVSGTIRIRTDAREAAVAAAREVCAATLEEPGCKAYRFGFDVIDDTLVHVHEEWIDEDALATHMTTPHFAAFGEKLGDFVAGDVNLTKWVGAEAEPLFG